MQPRNTPPAIMVITAIAVWKRLTTRNVVEERSATSLTGRTWAPGSSGSRSVASAARSVPGRVRNVK